MIDGCLVEFWKVPKMTQSIAICLEALISNLGIIKTHTPPPKNKKKKLREKETSKTSPICLPYSSPKGQTIYAIRLHC